MSGIIEYRIKASGIGEEDEIFRVITRDEQMIRRVVDIEGGPEHLTVEFSGAEAHITASGGPSWLFVTRLLAYLTTPDEVKAKVLGSLLAEDDAMARAATSVIDNLVQAATKAGEARGMAKGYAEVKQHFERRSGEAFARRDDLHADKLRWAADIVGGLEPSAPDSPDLWAKRQRHWSEACDLVREEEP